MAQGVKNYCLDSKKKGQIRNEFDPSGMRWWLRTRVQFRASVGLLNLT